MTRKSKPNRHIGSSFEEYLDEQGILGEVDSVAQKRLLSWQLEQAMAKQGITKAQMARRMSTSRAAVDRLLDPDNTSVTLVTMSRAAAAIGAELQIGLSISRASKPVRSRK